MSNRVLGFLVILIFILFGITFFMYAFLYNSSKFIIESNISKYEVELYNKKTLKKYNFSCLEKKCELNKIPPFTYKLTLTKSGYIDKIIKKELPRNETIIININFQKDVILKEIIENKKFKIDKTNKNSPIIPFSSKGDDQIISKNKKSTKKLTAKERIEALIAKKNKIKNSLNKIQEEKNKELEKKLKYKFLKQIDLFKNTDLLKIKVLKTNGNKNIFFIKNGEKKYIFNESTANINEIKLKLKVLYIKQNSNFKINIITAKGTFIYSLKNKSLKYFNLFSDYIIYKNNYIGIVKNNDNIRKNNFGFENEKQNLIILYNTKTLSKKIIFKTDLKIKKILLENNDIILENYENKKFKLKNFE